MKSYYYIPIKINNESLAAMLHLLKLKYIYKMCTRKQMHTNGSDIGIYDPGIYLIRWIREMYG